MRRVLHPEYTDEQIIAYTMEERVGPSAFQEMHLRNALALLAELKDVKALFESK